MGRDPLTLDGPIVVKLLLRRGEAEFEGDAELELDARDLYRLAAALTPYLRHLGVGTVTEARGRDIQEQ